MPDMLMRPSLLKLFYYISRLQRRLFGRSRLCHQADSAVGAFYKDAWNEAARRLGATVESMGNGVLRISRGDVSTRVFRQTTPLDDALTSKIAYNKLLTYKLLEEHRVPVTRYAEFSLEDVAKARAFLESSDRACVVKPVEGAAGYGVTTGVRSRWDLARAVAEAAMYSSSMLIEQQVPGDVYRLMYLDGVLVDAVLRLAPAVTGDGRTTIRDLIAQQNRQRARSDAGLSQTLLTIDREMHQTLRAQGLNLRSVPPEGARIRLKTVANENSSIENKAAKEMLCQAIVAVGARAADAMGVRLAGVDVITRDPTVPLEVSGGVMLEVNTGPGFFYHYHSRPNGCPVAVPILERLLDDFPPAGRGHRAPRCGETIRENQPLPKELQWNTSP